MPLLPEAKNCDISIKENFRLISNKLGYTASPTYKNITLTDLTASSLVGTNASKLLESVTIGTGLAYSRPTLSLSHLGIEALTDPGADKILFWDDSATACKWLGVGNSVAITDVTLDTIQDIRTSASPTLANLGLGTGELTAGSINRASGTLTLEIGGTAEISITSSASTFGGNIVIPDSGTIGSVSDTDVMTIDNSGNCTFSVFPITPSAAPDADYEVSNKKYVDDTHAGAPAAHTHDGDTLQLDGVNSDGGAFSLTTTGTVTFNQSIAAANYTAANLLTACATSAGGLDFSSAVTLTVAETETTTNYHTDTRAATWLAANHETTYNHTNYNTAYNDSITAIAFNIADGIITITQQDAGTLTTVSLDGRYYTEAEIGAGYQPLDAGLTSLAGLVYASDSFIKVTATDTYAIRTIAETKTDLSLNLVENTALSTWAGTTNITTLGTITTVGNITIADGGTIGQAAGPLLNFDDTNNFLEITGCSIGVGTATPDRKFVVEEDGPDGVFIRSSAANYSSLGFGVNTTSGYTYIQSKESGTGDILPLHLYVGSAAEISITATESTFGGNILIPDAGTIGSASDTDAISISATGEIDITAHDLATTGLKLGGTLVTASAAELNLLDGII